MKPPKEYSKWMGEALTALAEVDEGTLADLTKAMRSGPTSIEKTIRFENALREAARAVVTHDPDAAETFLSISVMLSEARQNFVKQKAR